MSQDTAAATPVVEPPRAGPASEAAATPTQEHQPARQEDELRCTLCGLRACWTA